jgi:hypothetical protein
MRLSKTTLVAVAALAPFVVTVALTLYVERRCACLDELVTMLAESGAFSAVLSTVSLGVVVSVLRAMKGRRFASLSARGLLAHARSEKSSYDQSVSVDYIAEAIRRAAALRRLGVPLLRYYVTLLIVSLIVVIAWTAWMWQGER